MKKYLFEAIILLVTCHQVMAAKLGINDGWLFQKGEVVGAEAVEFDSSDWEAVELPHTYNPSGSEEIYREQQEAVQYVGPAWYRKNLFVDQAQKGKRLFLRFDAAYLRSDVFLNGEKIGRHDGGFSAFCYEITGQVNYGADNVIAVRVNNEFNDAITPLGGGYLKFGGITRPVWLIEKPQVCISPVHYASSGVYCRQLDVSPERAELEIDTVLNAPAGAGGKYKVVCTIKDSSGTAVAKESRNVKVKAGEQWTVTVPMEVMKPSLWNGLENPALYQLSVELQLKGKTVDQVDVTTGFKTVAVDRDKGFFLNGKSYPLYGCAQHQYYPGVGSAMRAEHFERDAEIMEDLGMNAVRLSHYPHSEYRFDLCDKAGIVVFTEMALINLFNGSEAYTANCEQQLKEMIYQLYNHPSVAIWGLYNELRSDEWKGFNGLEFLAGLNRTAKEIDPARLTCGVSWKAGERNDIPDINGWNRYQGWYWNAYEGGPSDFSWIDTMRDEFPNRKLGITEYGAGAASNHFDEHRRIAPYNKDQFHPQDFYNWSHEEHWAAMQQRPWLWGTFIWTLSEFLVPNYDQGRATFLHDKGLVGEDRKQFKDAFFFYKANWNPEPMLHLCDKRFDVRLLDTAEITAYSNLDEVELIVNGTSMGKITDAEYGIHRWNKVPLKSGENKITVSSGTFAETAVWHRVTDIQNDSVLKEIVPSGSEWTVFFSDLMPKYKRAKGVKGIPGADSEVKYADLDAIWKQVDEAGTSRLPLIADQNWKGKAAYLKKTFKVDESGVKNPCLYLKQTARLSQANPGRVAISIDGRNVLTLEEGCDGYRLIPVGERCGQLTPGMHTITVIAEKPLKGGFVDIGLVEHISQKK
ncbi:glycoside hydrolase family 2 protein [Pontiella agarivorans]|uniref:Glycoside hydrolase family 2 TIM barrel-domain containing protein n=1 Tax=Pontiella agarivorans TaxID=3038953 RepID=A0ABU5N1B6_9BACT|nr:glycoside hydrolase family 2 TIM barrel-domain containing protein [Pontiella agarivorans]MDZ8120242.1 glycoside hydrolase family 2 TIM barrel-domain containing protein [Pontiella agarivorans]